MSLYVELSSMLRVKRLHWIDGDGQCRLIIPIDRLDSLVRFSYKTELVNREVIKPLSKDKW